MELPFESVPHPQCSDFETWIDQMFPGKGQTALASCLKGKVCLFMGADQMANVAQGYFWGRCHTPSSAPFPHHAQWCDFLPYPCYEALSFAFVNWCGNKQYRSNTISLLPFVCSEGLTSKVSWQGLGGRGLVAHTSWWKECKGYLSPLKCFLEFCLFSLLLKFIKQEDVCKESWTARPPSPLPATLQSPYFPPGPLRMVGIK